MTTYQWFKIAEMTSWPAEHKKCRTCQEVKPFSEFHKMKQGLFGLNTHCKECRKPKSKINYSEQTIEYKLYFGAKSRSKLKKIPFDLKPEDIVVPDVCPVFGTEFVSNDPDRCATLDRLDPRYGYIAGNVIVMSGKANRMKSNGNLQDILDLAEWALGVLY